MVGYRFEIKQAERVIHVVESISLATPQEIWGVIDDLANVFDAPGLRIIVKDEAGRIVVMAGLTRPRSVVEQSAA